MYTLLNIAQAKQAVQDGHKITCADGCKWFAPAVTRAYGWNAYHLSQASFDHLVKHGLIEFEGLTTSGCLTAVWAPTEKGRQ